MQMSPMHQQVQSKWDKLKEENLDTSNIKYPEPQDTTILSSDILKNLDSTPTHKTPPLHRKSTTNQLIHTNIPNQDLFKTLKAQEEVLVQLGEDNLILKELDRANSSTTSS